MKTLNDVNTDTAIKAIEQSISVLQCFRASAYLVDEAGELLIRVLKKGGRVLTCGNGGSAADALHMAEELVGRYRGNRRPLPGLCLCSDVTAITCIGNDFGFEKIFSRQLNAVGADGDALVCFSTSGNSPNIIDALVVAKQKGIQRILVSGVSGGGAKNLSNLSILVPSDDTARIQEVHTLILHHWLEMIEQQDWGNCD